MLMIKEGYDERRDEADRQKAAVEVTLGTGGKGRKCSLILSFYTFPLHVSLDLNMCDRLFSR